MAEEQNIKEIEKKWQQKWEQDKVFEPKPDKTKEKFFATVPYPYANSAMHIGHGRGFITPDIYIRYQRLLGKNVLYPIGYHISGTPVLAVADAIKRGDEKQIKTTRDAISDHITNRDEQDKIIETFKDPYKIAEFFMKTIKTSFQSVGLSTDWSREFSTGDAEYQKFIEWQFEKLNEAGILVKGKYPILYSPEDKNAVGEDDIKDGDIDKVSVQEMSYILFKLKDINEYIAVATLRPDALFGTTNLWIQKNIPLQKIKIKNKTIIVAKDAIIKIKHQQDIEELEDINPEKLIGKKAITPLINREIIIAEANFLDSKHGTGIVYSSPAGAPHDYIALIEAKKEGRVPNDVNVICTVDTYDKKGNKIIYAGECPAEDKIKKYKVKNSKDEENLEKAKQELYKEEHYSGKLNSECGEFEGLPIKYAKDKVQKKLEEQELGGILYETSRRAKTRGDADVIVANLDGQWFLDYTKPEIKEKAHKLLDEMTYNPQKMKATQRGYIDWVAMRPCARKRGIGTPLPFDKDWVIESLSDSTIYQMYYLCANIITREKIKPEQLTQEFFDYILLGQGNHTLIAEDTNIPEKIIHEMREEVTYWKAFDFRYTAGAHISNHLSFLIYHYALIFPKDMHPKNITIGGMLIKDGQKISKSKGNGIPLVRIKEKYGVDLYRLYIAVGANYDVELDFRDEEITQLERKLAKWKQLIQTALELEMPKYEDFDDIDKWLISKFYTKTKEYFEMFNSLRMREAYVAILYEFLNDVTYHERRCTNNKTQKVIRFIAEDYIKLMSPAIPHICEEYYSKLKQNEYVSLAKYETNPDKYINKDIEDIEEIAQELITNIARMKSTKNINKIQKITIVQAPQKKFELYDEIKKQLSENKNIKDMLKELNTKFPEYAKYTQKFVPKLLGDGMNTYLTREDERKFLENIKDYIAKEYECQVEIREDKDAENRANPARPAIIID
ncbi:MAG: leucine--tRNA ligase [Candidatus Woesearchaeota archaeon]